MEPDIQRWLDFAEKDLDVAKHLMTSFQPTPYEIICYHCQQAAEKTIKAVYLTLKLNDGLPRKHDLTFLLEQMKNRVTIPDCIFDDADRLNIYSVIVRYPSEMQLDAYQTERALRCASEVMNWGKQILRKSNE